MTSRFLVRGIGNIEVGAELQHKWIGLNISSVFTRGRHAVCFVVVINARKQTALDRGQTDRINLAHDLDLDLWPWPSIPCEVWLWPADTQKFKVNGQSVLKIDGRETDRRTDRRTEAIALPDLLMQFVVCNGLRSVLDPIISGILRDVVQAVSNKYCTRGDRQ